MNHEKKLRFRAKMQRIEHHLTQLAAKLELGTAKVDLEPTVELLCLLHEQVRDMSGGTAETGAAGEKISKLAAQVDAIPHLQLVR